MSNIEKAMAHLRVIYAYTSFALKRGTCFVGLKAICDIEERASDALALLKEQEARLLTEEEIQKLDEGQFVWIQIKDDMLYCLEIIGMCGVPGKYTDIQFNAPASFPELNIERYKKIWVAWTTQPTEEQQDEVKWDA